MMQTVRTEFLAPQRKDLEWGMATNDEDTLAVVAWGYFEQSMLSRTVTVYGDGSVRSWRWYGKLPLGIEPTAEWTVKAKVQDKDRKFVVRGATLGETLVVELTEV